VRLARIELREPGARRVVNQEQVGQQPHFYIYLANLRAAAGDRPGALAAVAGAERHIETTGEAMAESELRARRRLAGQPSR
jgi:hypothetical protein